MWQGMLYFGLNADGLIDTLIFDRKISPLRPSWLQAKDYPWFQPAVAKWQPDLVSARSSGGVHTASIDDSFSSWDLEDNILQ
jgi:hypothetical protein